MFGNIFVKETPVAYVADAERQAQAFLISKMDQMRTELGLNDESIGVFYETPRQNINAMRRGEREIDAEKLHDALVAAQNHFHEKSQLARHLSCEITLDKMKAKKRA